ncbi:MAG: hypothetical protein HRU78_07175 [Gammaproteobacteria bacterium]|nr:MAG: hypothetical protein HRU78_07175 [Gammaproteobacteria bacterium]
MGFDVALSIVIVIEDQMAWDISDPSSMRNHSQQAFTDTSVVYSVVSA